MSQASTHGAEQPAPLYKDTILHRIDQSWSALEQLLGGLTEAQLTTIRDQQGWTVKDHLVHLTAWEQSLLALLEGRDRNAALGLGALDREALAVDDVNDIIYQHSRERSLDDVRTALQRSHEQVRAAIVALSDDDLLKPYGHYQPNAPHPEANDQPVIGWIMGNTYDHYADHRAWIEGLLAAQ